MSFSEQTEIVLQLRQAHWRKIKDLSERIQYDTLEVLQELYSSEINASISSFWDSGWLVQLGDEMNGFKESITLDSHLLHLAGTWLRMVAMKHYPESDYAKKESSTRPNPQP